MNYKTCNGCGLPKEITAFSRLSKSKDGLQPRCKRCNADYFTVNRERLIVSIRERSRRVLEEKQEIVWQHLMKHNCIDCGESDPIVLEFDHTRDKKKGVSELLRDSRDAKYLIQEIEKCEIRCANCHRRKTANDLGWFRAKRVRENK